MEISARRAAAEWRDDPEVAGDIEARLRRSGFDSSAITPKCSSRRENHSTCSINSFGWGKIAVSHSFGRSAPRICQARPTRGEDERRAAITIRRIFGLAVSRQRTRRLIRMPPFVWKPVRRNEI